MSWMEVDPPYPDGTRIEKINSKPGDGHQDGAQGRVAKSFGRANKDVYLKDGDVVPAGTYGYFVVWDDTPGLEVFITGTRIRKL